jgi:hypothetical protein
MRLAGGHLPPSVAARCEGCGLAYVFDLLGLSGELVDVCTECGSPVYVVAPEAEGDAGAVFLAGFGAGWDASAELAGAGPIVADGGDDRLASLIAPVHPLLAPGLGVSPARLRLAEIAAVSDVDQAGLVGLVVELADVLEVYVPSWALAERLAEVGIFTRHPEAARDLLFRDLPGGAGLISMDNELSSEALVALAEVLTAQADVDGQLTTETGGGS